VPTLPVATVVVVAVDEAVRGVEDEAAREKVGRTCTPRNPPPEWCGPAPG
jgi:hypothetical protein